MPDWTGLSDARLDWTFSCQNLLDFLMPETTGLSAARVPAKRSGLDLATKTPPPPLQLLTSSLYISATAGRTLVRCLYGRQPQCTLVHCILYLCSAGTVQPSSSSPPLVPLGQDGADLHPGASFTVTPRARLGQVHSQIQASIVFKTGFW